MAQDNREKYAYLDQLSTQRLEELLLAATEDASGRDSSEAVLHILEVLQEREDGLAAEPVDVDRAWEEFQTRYNTPEGEGLSLYPWEGEKQGHGEKASPAAKGRSRRPALWRTLRVVAATVAVLFVFMVGAQASGWNVFGALAQWTSETFHFGAKTYSEQYDMFLYSLGKNGISEDIAPKQFPPNFIASEPIVESNTFFTSVSIIFNNENNIDFSIHITHYVSSKDIEESSFEKDSTFIEAYTSNSRTFYIFSNVERVTATWTDGTFTETISGNISIDELKDIIDSIGGS